MATEAVCEYLKIQNRPYSVNDIVMNLHNEYGKSAVQKALDQLVSKGKVFEKIYGKQKIYCIVQDSKYDAEELMRIDKELHAHANEVEAKLQEVEREIRSKESALATLKSSLTLKEALKQRDTLKLSVKDLTKKLDNLMEAIGTEDLSESKRKAETTLDDYSREYSKRKRLCTEIVDCILENYPGGKNELYEEIGIEAKVV
ncbi:homologous-pairing protein 2 homolog [Cephus cinctus]|uniref:Homologous-pairing protein 2 homolog n=1 Tax=Cephus cinctus TaxID=211228 RepID=A0AAJ7RAG2_CEPCN|nr:homologous-pairing protein 2 homolog [Cephus cinctus]